MQVELPKAQEAPKFKDGFNLEVFLTDNWFYIASFILIVLLVYMQYKRKT
ncbi:hypothetical protein [Psychroflexus sp. ALD_RP9]|nr:hypothetical protein [Psychroflexus sp. ALD_RP9]QSS96354.1 hypothetical protein IMZ30_07755 [Psychroflexus sp. ALD_RP9]